MSRGQEQARSEEIVDAPWDVRLKHAAIACGAIALGFVGFDQIVDTEQSQQMAELGTPTFLAGGAVLGLLSAQLKARSNNRGK